ncbi:MAG: hypothetical protein JWQ92_1284 [Amnibacterium sp.]|nr:hypothetical protein [Amnibacterium sp.]
MKLSIRRARRVAGRFLWPVRVNRLLYLLRRLTHRWKLVHRAESALNQSVTVWQLGRERRLVFGDSVSQAAQSVVFTRGDWTQLRREYWGRALQPPVELPLRPRVLVLGLGGGTMVRILHQLTRPALMTVVELDPVVVDVAFSHMGLAGLTDLDVRIGDVRDVLPALAGSEPYDLLFEDVFFDGLAANGIEQEEYLDALAALVTSSGWLVFNRWFRDWGGKPIDSGQEQLASALAGRFTVVERVQVAQRWFNELVFAGRRREASAEGTG